MNYHSPRESREPDWGERVIAAVTMGVVAGLLLLLAPGIIFDWAIGRFADAPDGLLTSATKDGVTWLVSFLFWMSVGALVVTRYKRHARLDTPPEDDFSGTAGNVANGYGRWQQPPPQPEAGHVHAQAAPPPEDGSFLGLCTDEACAEVLGLSGDLTMENIRSAYRQRIAAYHPDKVAHLGSKLREVAESESKRLNIAYQYFEERYGQVA